MFDTAPSSMRRSATPDEPATSWLAQTTEQLRAESVLRPPFKSCAFDEIQGREIDWLWKDRLAKGKLHLWAGRPGLGKTTAACDLAARVSAGLPWPDGQPGPAAGCVVHFTADDSPEDTLKSRLQAAGADCERIRLIDLRPRTLVLNASLRDPSMRCQRYLYALDALLGARGDVSLVVIDHINAFLAKPLTALQPDDLYALETLARIAETHNAAIVATASLPDTSQPAATHRALGTLGFLAPARLIFAFVDDPDDADAHDSPRVLMLTVRSNICRKAGPLAFRIGDRGIVWETAPDTADIGDILNRKPGKAPDMLARAKLLIVTRLAAGPIDSEELKAELLTQGISRRTFVRAKSELSNVKAEKQPGRNGKWTLSLQK